MPSLLAALLLLATPARAEWRCPEPPPPPVGTEKSLLLRLRGTRGESASGSYTDDLFGVGPAPFPLPSTWRLVLPTAGADGARLAAELRSASAARLAAAERPPEDAGAAALAAAMLACAVRHPGFPLPHIESWLGEQDEQEPAMVLAALIPLEVPGEDALSLESAAIRNATSAEALDRLGWRLLELERREGASRAWFEAADRDPTALELPLRLDRAASVLVTEARLDPRPRLGRRALLERLAAALAPGSPWHRAHRRRVRRALGLLRGEVELELALTTPEETSRADALEAWLSGRPQDARALELRWIQLAALVGEDRAEEALAALDRGVLSRDPRAALLRVAALARTLRGGGASPPGANARLIEELRGLREQPFPTDEQRELADELGFGATLLGHRTARSEGDVLLAGAYLAGILSGELCDGLVGRGGEAQRALFFLYSLVRFTRDHLDEEPGAPTPAPGLDLPAELLMLEERWAALDASCGAGRAGSTVVPKKRWADAVGVRAECPRASRWLLLQQLLAAEALLGVEGFDERSAGVCSTGLAWYHLSQLRLVPAGGTGLYRTIGFWDTELYEPATELARHHLNACGAMASEQLRWTHWQHRAEQALHDLDLFDHPDPSYLEHRLEPQLPMSPIGPK